MSTPSKALVRLAGRLFDHQEDQTAFIQALTQPPTFAPTILWTRPRPAEVDWEILPPLSWQPNRVDRLVPSVRPGQHPLHDQGYYYCLDFSSVFAAAAMQVIPSPVNVAIDVCAAPGGKSLFTWTALRPQRLLCNEVIRKRVRILIANLKRCGAMEAIALSQDPSVLAAQMPGCAQLVLVDAPCSGQSLLAKGQSVPGCFHKVTVNRNANRQKRIVANATQLVQPKGYLLYSTCTYDPAENEQVCAWLLKRFPEFRPVDIPFLQAHRSTWADFSCYRLWPQSGLGAGAFTMLFKRDASGSAAPIDEAFLHEHQYLLRPNRRGELES